MELNCYPSLLSSKQVCNAKLIHFSEGEFKFKMNERTADKIVDFMKE